MGLHQPLGNSQIGTVASINLSPGGVPKKSTTGARVSRLGLVGDAQNDTKHHGGPERAVCIYSLEHTDLKSRASHRCWNGGEN
jgi:MOSC domain-containing protein YiiM